MVPIDQIKVGDLVLSRPEDGGERCYKRVTRTARHDFQEVVLLNVGLLEGPRSLHTINEYFDTEARQMVGKGRQVPGSGEYFIATPNHLLFAKRGIDRLAPTDPNPAPAWTELAWLPVAEVETLGDTTAVIYGIDWIHHSGDPGVGYVPSDHRRWDNGGLTVEMAGTPLVAENADIPPIAQGNSPRVLVTVYRLEVEDNHTYYVGRSGLLIHDGSAGAPRGRP